MKKVFLFLISVLFVVPVFAQKYTITPLPYKDDAKFLQVQNLTDQFDYALLKTDKQTDRTGKVFHYKKSNQDGSNADDVWIYYPNPYRSENFYIFQQDKNTFSIVYADYDKNYQSVKMISYAVDKKLKFTENAVSELNGNTITLKAGGKKKDDVTNGIIPSYNLNFDFTDLNSMIPFLKNKEADFTFGFNNLYVPSKAVIAKASVGLTSRIEMYVGKTVCRYIGKSTYKGSECFVYNIVVEGYENLSGKIYVDTSDYSVVEINTQHFGNPLYDSFKFTLIEKTTMTAEEWKTFYEGKIKEGVKK